MKKKIILFLVEGRNDEKEINAMMHTPYFSESLARYDLQFKILNGDITSVVRGKASIRCELEKIIQKWRNGEASLNPVKTSEIQEVVHVVDLDGTFIPREAVMSGDVGGLRYDDETITASNPGHAWDRNAIKSKNLEQLVFIKHIDNLPYSIYYVSCNMDHVLSDNRNAFQSYKDQYARDFRNICKANPKVLLNSVFKEGIATDLTYEESWEEVKNGTNSLKRSTNLNLFFERYGSWK